MTEEEYIEKRVNDQIQWYSKKSAINKNYHLSTRGLVIVFAALIPFAAGFITEKTIQLNYVIAVLGVLTAIFTGLSELLKFQEKWIEYRITSEKLKHEKILFKTNSGPYNRTLNQFKFFVSRIENLINKENSAWSQHVKKEN